MGGKVSVLRDRDGQVKRVDGDRLIFTKDGVYFTLDPAQMTQMRDLVTGIQSEKLVRIDPHSDDMVLAD